MRRHFVIILVGLVVGAAGCGGYGGGSPSAPDGLGAAPDGAIVINIVGDNGNRSFSPNPATIPAGQMVTWHNVDSQVHHVVLDDGRIDTGNIAPGRFTAAMAIPVSTYHCTIHPGMVGTIVAPQ